MLDWKGDTLYYTDINGRQSMKLEADITNALASGGNIYITTTKADFVLYRYIFPERVYLRRVMSDIPEKCPLCKGSGYIKEI